MSEYAAPTLEVAPGANLTDLLFDVAAARPDAPALARREGGAWRDVSAAAFRDEVLAAAKGLVAAGVRPGDRIGLMSRTRYEWTLLDFAIWCAGAVSVPVYDTSSAEQACWMLGDAGAVGCFVETGEHAATVAEARGALPGLRHVWGIEDGAGDETLSALVAAGAAVPDEEIGTRRAQLCCDSLATIIYTSGTTGRPKGCELTHGNFGAEVAAAIMAVPEVFAAEGASTLLFLPLAHVLARAVQLMCVAGRVRLAHTSDIPNLAADLADYRPTFLLAVPRVFEKVYNAAEQKAAAAGRDRVFAAARDTAVAYSRALDAGGPRLALRLRHAVFDRLVYGKLRKALGGRLDYAVSGGAPLGERLGHFYRGVGVVILEGYGLSETTAASNVNTPSALRVGTVGRPLPGNRVRIAEDGEVLLKGAVVFRGYHGDPRATAEALTPDGWLHTGDLGELEDGFLRITGRKKEILVTAAGKNVAPAVLEDALRASPLVNQCLVVGEGRPYVGALVTLDPEALPAWLAARGRPVGNHVDVAAQVDDPDVVAEVQRAVDEANARVSRAESIRRFRILPVDFTEQGGHLTPTLKLKRSVVLQEFAGEVDALYAASPGRAG